MANQPSLFEARKPEPIKLERLLLDPDNPRLDPQQEFSIEDQDKILEFIAAEYHLDELFDSIIASGGYWAHEPLIARQHGKDWIVVEGNRRLAAVKLLVVEGLANRIGYRGVPEIDEKLRKNLQDLPVLQGDPAIVWGHIGFKHVNGPKQWDSIAKARYIARIHEQQKIDLDVIAKTIGDRNATVKRLYQGLKVLEESTALGVFDPEDRFYNGRAFAFTHLWTGIGYEKTRSYLGITPATLVTQEPVPRAKAKELGLYCRWLYGSKKDGFEPYVKSQNPHLRLLDEVLGAPAGIEALEQGRPLDKALEAAAGDKKLLRRSLEQAERGLKDARSYFATGFEGEEDLAEQIKSIHKNAKALRNDLKTALGDDED
jgi:hypothetical protein